MKRLLIAAAALCAFAAFAAASASAGTSLTISVAPAAPTAAAPVTFTVTGPADTAAAYWISTGTCEDEGDTVAYSETWPFSGSWAFSATLAAGTYAVDVATYSEDWTCETVVVAAETIPAVPSDTITSSYLCWNREMTDPVAYIDRTADEMWATGKYFEPQAILGNVAGGTNVGAYHLVCNAPATMKITATGVGGSGEVYTAEQMAAYHAAHAAGNDLNVYHIWQ